MPRPPAPATPHRPSPPIPPPPKKTQALNSHGDKLLGAVELLEDGHLSASVKDRVITTSQADAPKQFM